MMRVSAYAHPYIESRKKGKSERPMLTRRKAHMENQSRNVSDNLDVRQF